MRVDVRIIDKKQDFNSITYKITKLVVNTVEIVVQFIQI